MRLIAVVTGPKFEVLALDISREPGISDCPATAFLDDLKSTMPAAYKSIVGVIRLHANQGPLRNEQKSRLLRDGIYEFKSRQGARILWFYGQRGQTVLTHGFKKGVSLDPEIKRARDLRSDWEREQSQR